MRSEAEAYLEVIGQLVSATAREVRDFHEAVQRRSVGYTALIRYVEIPHYDRGAVAELWDFLPLEQGKISELSTALINKSTVIGTSEQTVTDFRARATVGRESNIGVVMNNISTDVGMHVEGIITPLPYAVSADTVQSVVDAHDSWVTTRRRIPFHDALRDAEAELTLYAPAMSDVMQARGREMRDHIDPLNENLRVLLDKNGNYQ